MRARFRPQSGALLVVLLDVGFLVPSFQAVVFLLGALQAASRAAGLQPTLEKPGDNVGLADGASQIQQPTKKRVQALNGTENQIMAALDLIQIPRIAIIVFAYFAGEQRDEAINPAVTEVLDG